MMKTMIRVCEEKKWEKKTFKKKKKKQSRKSIHPDGQARPHKFYTRRCKCNFHFSSIEGRKWICAELLKAVVRKGMNNALQTSTHQHIAGSVRQCANAPMYQCGIFLQLASASFQHLLHSMQLNVSKLFILWGHLLTRARARLLNHPLELSLLYNFLILKNFVPFCRLSWS